MRRSRLRTLFALAAMTALPALALAQATPTPLTSTLATPDPGLYKIPPTTPIGMPAYSITPATTSPAAETPTSSRPAMSFDCANGGWRAYSALKFKTETACRSWVSKHPAGGSISPSRGAKTSGTGSRTATPRVRATPPAVVVPPGETTPGSSITPLLNPTPNPG